MNLSNTEFFKNVLNLNKGILSSVYNTSNFVLYSDFCEKEESLNNTSVVEIRR